MPIVGNRPRCQRRECRRVQLLNYFGQPAEPCGNCDTCQNPPESWDGTVAAQKVLSTVYRLQRERGQKFGTGHIVDILLGKQTDKISQFRHQDLTVYGIGAELRDGEWRGVVRQMLAQGLLAVEGDYGTLVLTEASGEVLGKRRDVRLRKEPERAKQARSSRKTEPAADLPPEARDTFELLRSWRAATAKEQGVPAYVIFHDATLREIATKMPSTVDELGRVNGVGKAKLERYAEQILDTLSGAAQAEVD